MEFFIVELTEEETHLDEERNRLLLNLKEYLEFVRAANELGILEGILKKIDFQCAKCKSFTLPAIAFYKAVIGTIDMDCVYDIIHGVTERIYLTEEEWIQYTNYGQESVDIIKDASLVETNGELYRFVAKELFFRFDSSCECNSILGSS
ncbi:MAG TPA: hypothetical protein VFG09_09985 [Thermodesulfovibrionales bacterium]|nr:hypothetical protein [Thermodesulfovibrionales bacterium]